MSTLLLVAAAVGLLGLLLLALVARHDLKLLSKQLVRLDADLAEIEHAVRRIRETFVEMDVAFGITKSSVLDLQGKAEAVLRRVGTLDDDVREVIRKGEEPPPNLLEAADHALGRVANARDRMARLEALSYKAAMERNGE